MTDPDLLAQRFEAHREHLRGVAVRMLGSSHEADDAVQEAWLRLTRTDPAAVDNLGGWLTTVVARVCLDILRTRTVIQEVPPEGQWDQRAGDSPEDEALLADSVGLALLVVLDTLAPAERLAFVLHDMFAVPFEEIAPIVGRTPAAARQLASRARRRVQADPAVPDVPTETHRAVVAAFLAASRQGDFAGLIRLLTLRWCSVPTPWPSTWPPGGRVPGPRRFGARCGASTQWPGCLPVGPRPRA